MTIVRTRRPGRRGRYRRGRCRRGRSSRRFRPRPGTCGLRSLRSPYRCVFQRLMLRQLLVGGNGTRWTRAGGSRGQRHRCSCFGRGRNMAIAPSTMLALQSAVGGCGMGERGDVADRHEGASALPGNPIAAVTHPDPYPCYADLVATTPLYRDDTLGLWVATSAEVVLAVLTSDLCRVRPAAEPVPKALLGSPAA